MNGLGSKGAFREGDRYERSRGKALIGFVFGRIYGHRRGFFIASSDAILGVRYPLQGASLDRAP
jgi:hypothetical protein